MKKAFITLLSLLFLSMPAYGWEMYVSNESADAITVYNQTGALIKTITHPSINQPCQSAFRNNGKLYVACAGSSKIVIIDETDNVIGAINSSYRPSGLAFGRNNHLYVGVENPNLQGFTEEYDESDNFVKSFQRDTILFKPNAMTIGLNDNLLVADNYNCQVVAFDFNGNFINQFSTGSKSWPRGIAIGPDSFIYVAGDGMNNVSVFDPNIYTLARTITGVTAPYGITFDPENHHLFVANFGANNILEYLYTGELIGVFASGLSHPTHIAFKAQPTLIKLSSFHTTAKANRIILEWSTASEIDNAGFNLYRAEAAKEKYKKINGSLILADGSSIQGAFYEFTDNDVKNRKTYYYKLEDIDFSGKSTMHGPVQATPRWIYGASK